jgi:hypothetical protein
MTPLGGLPRTPMFDAKGNFTAPWAGWFSIVQSIAQADSSSGPTTSRPTTNLYLGMQWFDTTLGYPVWVASLGPPAVWHNAAGAPV